MLYLINIDYFTMFSKKLSKILVFILILPFLFNSCANRGDARKSPPNPKERLKRNMEEGRGFRIMDSVQKSSTNYEFATTNELWRASLDSIDFMPLSSVNYSGGIIVTDWYSNNQNNNESVKISIRFLTNEIRSDALNIKLFKKVCNESNNCKVSESSGEVIKELKKKILTRAKIYEAQKKERNFKSYNVPKD
ncbi:DUF3576 domain-containing protein [Candidatus Pelagibacter sp.]|jgi:hypothetical protein|nr:DUF3576 domain-containing protein [Candidatus Pelagibacter sp.]